MKVNKHNIAITGSNGYLGSCISDFLAKDYETNLKLTEQKHDLIAISITDPREKYLPTIGYIHLQDAESGETLLVDTSDKEMIKHLTFYEQKRREKLKKSFNSMGVDTIEIETDGSLAKPIIRYFKMREKRH